MKVDIHANSINQILNADLINIDQIKNLSKTDQDKIANELINKIHQQLDDLIKKPKAISESDLIKIADIIKSNMPDSKSHEDEKSKGSKIGSTLKKINEYMGNTSGIILNIIKLGQIFGV